MRSSARQRALHCASRHSRHCDLRSQRKISGRFTVGLYLGTMLTMAPAVSHMVAKNRASHRSLPLHVMRVLAVAAALSWRQSECPAGSISRRRRLLPRRVVTAAAAGARPRRRPPVLLRARHPDSRALVQRHRPAVCTAGTSRTWRTNKATCARRAADYEHYGRPETCGKGSGARHEVWQAQLSHGVGDRHAPRRVFELQGTEASDAAALLRLARAAISSTGYTLTSPSPP